MKRESSAEEVFSLGWRARARPVAHSQTAWVTQATISGRSRPGRAQKSTGESRNSGGREVGLPGGLEDQAAFCRGDPASANAPPVDQEASGEGDGDLLGAARVGVEEMAASPDDGFIVGLELV